MQGNIAPEAIGGKGPTVGSAPERHPFDQVDKFLGQENQMFAAIDQRINPQCGQQYSSERDSDGGVHGGGGPCLRVAQI